MLFADKAALENRTKVRLLTIRERELALYTNNCRTVGTVSALMAGIAYSALIYTKMSYFQYSPVAQQFLYITGLVVCMCLSLRNVLGTTMLTMLGPGKALRGPDGSMHSAVDGMLEAFEDIAVTQHQTIYSFMLTAIVYSWGAASMSAISSIILTILLVVLIIIMLKRSQNAENTFPLRTINEAGQLVSGAFFPKAKARREERGALATVGKVFGIERDDHPGNQSAFSSELNSSAAPAAERARRQGGGVSNGLPERAMDERIAAQQRDFAAYSRLQSPPAQHTTRQHQPTPSFPGRNGNAQSGAAELM